MVRVRMNHIMIWAWIRLHVLYEERKDKTVPLVAKVYTAKKKSIFVEGLNFYFEHNTVRAVWSRSEVYLIYWALFILCGYSSERTENSRALQQKLSLWDFVWFTTLWGLSQCACVQCIALCIVKTRRKTVWFVLYVMSWTRGSVPHYSASHWDVHVHTWLSVVSLPFGLFVLYKCGAFWFLNDLVTPG